MNHPPVAPNITYNTPEDTLLNVTAPGLLAFVTDVDGDSLSLSALQTPSAQGGTVQVQADGSFVYQPAVKFNGKDSFPYQVSDGNATVHGYVIITVGESAIGQCCCHV